MLAGFFSSRPATPVAKLPADARAWPAAAANSPDLQPTASLGATDRSPRRLSLSAWREAGDSEAGDQEARDQEARDQEARDRQDSHERLLTNALNAPDEMDERAPDQDEQTSEHADQSDSEEREFSFKRFVNHRWVGDSMEIQVEWDRGGKTWEPETNLHADALSSLLQYWARRGGRPTNPADPDMFDIFAVRQHSANRKRLLVEWTGYDPKETSWVPCRTVEETAPELVAEYWKRARRGPGRPRKKKKSKSSV